jgi:hypothetical protein
MPPEFVKIQNLKTGKGILGNQANEKASEKLKI